MKRRALEETQSTTRMNEVDPEDLGPLRTRTLGCTVNVKSRYAGQYRSSCGPRCSACRELDSQRPGIRVSGDMKTFRKATLSRFAAGITTSALFLVARCERRTITTAFDMMILRDQGVRSVVPRYDVLNPVGHNEYLGYVLRGGGLAGLLVLHALRSAGVCAPMRAARAAKA